MKGYKVFNPDWTCRDKQYEVGKTYEEDVDPKLCKQGMHFCTDLIDCFSYYSFNPDNKVAIVEAIGDVCDPEDSCSKRATNKLKIIEEISWQEVLELCNTGKGNTGKGSSGDHNSGNWNSGNRNTGKTNSGNWNSGYQNSGDQNSGNQNSGYWNSGNQNSGYQNSGDQNSGNRNSGNWNSCNYSTGFFNTKEQPVFAFNEPLECSRKEFLDCVPLFLLFDLTEWVYKSEMTEKEKRENPDYETQGGYLKVYDFKEAAQRVWDNASEEERGRVWDIPNFDPDVFEEIFGIKVER